MKNEKTHFKNEYIRTCEYLRLKQEEQEDLIANLASGMKKSKSKHKENAVESNKDLNRLENHSSNNDNKVSIIE